MAIESHLTDENAVTTLYALIRGLRANVTRATVRETLEQHPESPSLLSLSDALTNWQIENASLQLNTVEQLRELPLPFIAHLRKNGGWYVLVTNLQSSTITYSDTIERKSESLTNFKKKWSGVVLLAEASEQAGEAGYKIKRRLEILNELRMPFVLGGAGVLFLLSILNITATFNIADWILLVSKSTGILLCSLLVAKQLGSKSVLTDRLCRVSSKTSCDDVLNSHAAKLWGWLSWTDVGLLYFAGGLLALQLTHAQPALRPLLYGLALLAVPYIFFSIYYQGFVVRQWCTLCLSVQAILLIEAIHSIIYFDALPGFAWPYLLISAAFLLAMLIWIAIKPLLIAILQTHQEHNELMRLKRDPKLFKVLLKQQPQMPFVANNLHPIILGNPEAEHTITMVTNPFCRPCARTHKELEQLLKQNQNIKATIIFDFDSANEAALQVAVHALALAEQGRASQALTDWYEQLEKNFDVWVKNYPLSSGIINLTSVAERHGDWCRMANIKVTPTIFVDGYQLPEPYQLSNLRWLIDYLPKQTLMMDLIKSQ